MTPFDKYYRSQAESASYHGPASLVVNGALLLLALALIASVVGGGYWLVSSLP